MMEECLREHRSCMIQSKTLNLFLPLLLLVFRVHSWIYMLDRCKQSLLIFESIQNKPNKHTTNPSDPLSRGRHVNQLLLAKTCPRAHKPQTFLFDSRSLFELNDSPKTVRCPTEKDKMPSFLELTGNCEAYLATGR